MKAFPEEDMEIALLWVETVALVAAYTTTPSILSQRVIRCSPFRSFRRARIVTECWMVIIPVSLLIRQSVRRFVQLEIFLSVFWLDEAICLIPLGAKLIVIMFIFITLC